MPAFKVQSTLFRLTKEKTIGTALLFILFLSAFFMAAYFPGLIKLELSVTDAKLIRYAEKFQAPSPIVIMDIDDASYGAVPAVLPWPRSYYARLIRNMNRAGARLIIIDIMFDKPRVDDKAGDDSLAQAIKEAGNVILSGKTVVEDNMKALVLPDPFLLNVCKSGFGIVNIKEDIDGVVRE